MHTGFIWCKIQIKGTTGQHRVAVLMELSPEVEIHKTDVPIEGDKGYDGEVWAK